MCLLEDAVRCQQVLIFRKNAWESTRCGLDCIYAVSLSWLGQWWLCAADPNALHYCWNVGVEDHDWKWYKHWFQHFNWAVCPPWPEFTNKHRRGLFPHPPRPSLLKSQARSFLMSYAH